MDYFTSRNLVILALLQVGILVASVLGAGVTYKWYHNDASGLFAVPWLCRCLMEFGWLGLVLPPAWLMATLWLLGRPHTSMRVPLCAVAAGFLLTILFLLLGWFGAVQPWLRLFHSGHAYF